MRNVASKSTAYRLKVALTSDVAESDPCHLFHDREVLLSNRINSVSGCSISTKALVSRDLHLPLVDRPMNI